MGMVATVTKVEHSADGEVSEVQVKLAKLSDTNKPKAFIQVRGNSNLIPLFVTSLCSSDVWFYID